MSVSNEELEAQILAYPDDKEAYAVYGDWLQSQGDDLGELVSVQLKLADAPTNADLLARQKALFEANVNPFFGPATEGDTAFETLELSEFRWGRPEGWPKEAWAYGFARTVWRYGFIQKLFYDTGYYDDEDERGSDVAVKPLVEMLTCPTARFVREIALGDLWADYDSVGGPEMGYAVDAIVGAPCAKTLRRIEFTGGEHDISGVLIHDHGLADACPQLEELVLYAGMVDLSVQNWPKLKSYAIKSGSLGKESLHTLAASGFPELVNLEIWFGTSRYGGDCNAEALKPLLTGANLPKINRLGLMNGEFGDELCAALVASAVLPRLEFIDLTMGVMRDAGAQILIDNADKLAHLETLDVAGYFSDSVAEALRAIGPYVSVEVRGPPDEQWVYTEVGE